MGCVFNPTVTMLMGKSDKLKIYGKEQMYTETQRAFIKQNWCYIFIL